MRISIGNLMMNIHGKKTKKKSLPMIFKVFLISTLSSCQSGSISRIILPKMTTQRSFNNKILPTTWIFFAPAIKNFYSFVAWYSLQYLYLLGNLIHSSLSIIFYSDKSIILPTACPIMSIYVFTSTTCRFLLDALPPNAKAGT